ncbi:hypothetical protein SELMODRAFT_115322 [Selaginella moellendorffii]|uniref:Uncharacterized protein CYP797H4 n=1 Tax=Selaginella moellendorffii TaxID=88036 RepID=D8SF95_SELML|nr:hypothetical protein SELMODRAFT_115322 [Selaginella moellendorffii]
MGTLLYVIILLAFVYVLRKYLLHLKLPPSPWGLPLLGHLHHLAGIPFLSLHALSKQYGPILFMKLGTVPAVVISSSVLAKEVLRSQDQMFASRPYILVGDYGLYHFQGIGPVPYNDHWKMMRKLCATELFTPKRIDSFLPIRLEEITGMFSALRGAGAHKAVDMRNMLSIFTFNVMTRILMNKRFFEYGEDEEHIDGEAKQFKDIVFETADQGLQFHISEFIPHWLRWIDWKVPELKRLHAKKDKFLQNILDQHKDMASTKEHKDFMDIMLQNLEHRGAAREDFIKAVVLELTIAGTDTSACIVEWTLLELLHNPRVLSKLKEELDAMVGSSSHMVEEPDFQNLDYLNAVIKEAFRLHPPLPLLIPHMSTQTCTIAGFHVPKNAFSFVNEYPYRKKAGVWEKADEFWPERFLGKSVDVRGQDFELLPFGSGRRACAGMQLGLKTVQLLVSNLVHAFDWSFVPGKPSEDYLLQERHGTVNWIKTPLQVCVVPRTR